MKKLRPSIIPLLSFIIILLSNVQANELKFQGKLKRLPPIKAILGGNNYPDQANPPKWVGAIYFAKRQSPDCTMTFISPIYILTAYHCLFDRELSTLEVGYTGRDVDGRFIYPKVAIESFVRYKDNYDIVIAKLVKPYPNRIESLSYYHGFYFEPGKNRNNYPITLFGYGRVDGDMIGSPPVVNKDSLLKQLPGQIIGLLYTPANLIINSSLGTVSFGDSGGPAIIKTKFAGLNYSSIIGVDIGVAIYDVRAIWLNSDILKWIAETTSSIIFKSPADVELILNKGTNIAFSGWGDIQKHNDKIIIYDSNNTKVTTCDNFEPAIDYTQPPAHWQCNIIINPHDDNESENYQARLYRRSIFQDLKWQMVDSVNFKLSQYGVHLRITHPDPSYGDEFTYHAPYKSTYLIAGEATPGDTLSYQLKKYGLTTTSYNNKPCINPEASQEIPKDGVWRCRIQINDKNNLTYKFTVKKANIRDALDKGVLASVSYKVEPSESFFINIIAPKANDVINADSYLIKSTFSEIKYNQHLVYKIGGFDKVYKIDIPLSNGSTYYNSLFPYEIEPWSISDIDLESDSTFVIASIYMDNDEDPIAESRINFFIKPDLIQIEYPLERLTVVQGTKLLIRGKATPNNLVKVVFRSLPNFDCKVTADIKGYWVCNNYLDTSTLQIGKGYTITANLLKQIPNQGESIVMSDIKHIFISSPLNIENPH